MYLMAIDTGTQSTRACLIDEEGNEVCAASRTQVMGTPHPGWATQRPSVWWHNAVECVRDIIKSGKVNVKKIVGIGTCGQMHGSVAIDTHGELIDFEVPLWCDKRESEGLKNMTADKVDSLYSKTGNLPLPAWVAFKMQWIKENMNEIYNRAFKFLVPKDFLNYMLTGEIATDPTEASGFFTYDANKEEWSREVTDALKLDFDKLPPIKPSYSELGVIKKDIASQLGLPYGIPVAVGAADFLCHHLSSGTNVPGQAMDLCGTSSCFSMVVEKPLFNRNIQNLRHITDSWISFGILDAGGGCLRWLRDNICVDVIERAARESKSAYELIIDEARRVVPGTEGLFFLPYLQGERVTGSAHSRGSYFGLTSFHKRKHLIHAVLEGVVLGLNQMVRIVKDAGISIDEVRFIGGCSRSDYWAQMRADCYDAKITVLKAVEGGILGAAILAGCAAGVFEGPIHASKKIAAKVDKEFHPDGEKVKLYRDLYNRFIELHDDFQKYFRRYYA
jgi:sugar (pentulose or hexulose) kinase